MGNATGGCAHTEHACTIISAHVTTKRENVKNHGGVDSLFDLLRNKGVREKTIESLRQWQYENDYNTESLTNDVAANEDSHLKKYLTDDELFGLIQSFFICNVDEHSDTMAKQI